MLFFNQDSVWLLIGWCSLCDSLATRHYTPHDILQWHGHVSGTQTKFCRQNSRKQKRKKRKLRKCVKEWSGTESATENITRVKKKLFKLKSTYLLESRCVFLFLCRTPLLAVISSNSLSSHWPLASHMWQQLRMERRSTVNYITSSGGKQYDRAWHSVPHLLN